MKLINNSNFNLLFLKLSGNFGLWLLLMSVSMNAYAQIHVSDNTTISVKKGTIVHVSDDIANDTIANVEKEKAKIYVGQSTQLKNFPTHADIEIVYQEKIVQPKKAKQKIQPQEKTELPEQPVAKKDDEVENRIAVLSFDSKQKEQSTLFYSSKTMKAALVNSGSFLVKIFPPKKSFNNILHAFLLKDGNQQIKTSFVSILPKNQMHFEEQITRPPPFYQNLI